MGVIEMPVSETERRKNHIDQIEPNHALLLIAKDCIRFQEKDRPSSEELCQRLASLKESRKYRESTYQIQDEAQSKSDQVLLLTQQLQDKDRRIHEMDDAISSKDRQVQDAYRALQQKENENTLLQQERASRERQLRQLNQQLEEHEQVTAETQQTNHSLQRQVEQLQQQLSQQSLKPPQPPPPSQAQVRGRQLQERESRKQLPVQPSLQVDHKPHPHRVRKMTLNWRDGGNVPFEMLRGAAVVNGNVAYFMSWNGEVCSYTVSRKKWSGLPKYPYITMVV
jgi:uncharacterized protein YwgA